ncbi:mitochondrial carrier domain-containing protein [Blastocladiella britannica]|nr:mitochondrial carrier domain-containing protein [Blastocladiella britannica]
MPPPLTPPPPLRRDAGQDRPDLVGDVPLPVVASNDPNQDARFRALVHRHRVTLAASSAAIVGNVAGYPFDTVKTRFQTFSYPSLSACIRDTYHTEGLHGFFRGIMPQLLASSFFKSASFAAYVGAKARVADALVPGASSGNSGTGGSDQQPALSPATTLLVSSFFGGMCSGAMIAVLTQPFELIKVLRQLQMLIGRSQPMDAALDHALHSPQAAVGAAAGSTATAALETAASAPLAAAKPVGLASASTILRPMAAELSTVGMAREIVRVRGPMGFGFGFSAHLLREMLGSAVYFSSYEIAKYGLSEATGSEPNLAVHILSGAFCGTLAWTIIFPTDVIKSTIQKDTLATTPRFTSVWACARSLYAQGGVRVFYRGISATMVRAAPIHSLNWAVYEAVLRMCTDQAKVAADDDGVRPGSPAVRVHVSGGKMEPGA